MSSSTSRLVLSLILLLLVVPAQAGPFGETRKYFDHWLGACRPDGYCSATAYVDPGANGTVAAYILRIGREAEQTYWQLSLTTVATMADERYPLTASVDDKSVGTFSPPTDIGAFGSINDFYFLGSGAQHLMDRLVGGHTVAFAFTATDGTAQEARFPLDGLSQALIWIDTLQHRIGSERVAEAPPYGLFRTDVTGAAWMAPALAAFFRQ